jgi:hypothetical protein
VPAARKEHGARKQSSVGVFSLPMRRAQEQKHAIAGARRASCGGSFANQLHPRFARFAPCDTPSTWLIGPAVHNFFASARARLAYRPPSLAGVKSIARACVKRAREIFPDRREVAVSSAFFAFRANERRNFYHRRTFAQRAKTPDVVDAR